MAADRPKRYWKSLKERDADPDFLRVAQNEFPQELDRPTLQIHRRDFLKVAGFGAAAAVLTGCTRAPVEKAIPMLVQPEEIIPGRALYYASTCTGCSAGCGLLVKSRDGRPIKLEGNLQQPLSRGGLCAVGQAAILGLYDSQRIKTPQRSGKDSTWVVVDGEITAQLEKIRAEKGAVRFLTGTLTSPTTRAAIAEFLKPFADARHVVYDPLSSSAILDAHERTHGTRLLPRHRFEKAEVIASFDADFLGTWISPVEFTAGYRAGRDLEARPPRMSWHAQFESRVSLTGSKADKRLVIAPGELGTVLGELAERLARKAGDSLRAGHLDRSSVSTAALDDLAQRLWQTRGRSLVVCGSQDVDTQVLCNYVNHVLGNYGTTLDLEHPSYQAQGNDRELEALLAELEQGKVRALLIDGVNPAYDLPRSDNLAATLRRVSLVVSFAQRPDETSLLARYVCPQPHALESWGDAEPVHGLLSLTQPVIRPLVQARPLVESLAAWSGAPRAAYDILRDRWQREVFPRQSREKSFQAFWDRSVQNGFAEIGAPPVVTKPFNSAALQPLAKAPDLPAGACALVLYPKIGLRDGRHAYNPWLQELPDPISKVAWDNYACLSPAAAARMDVSDGDTVTLDSAPPQGGPGLVLPVFVQPGQHDQVVAVALGYGSRLSARFAKIGPEWIEARPTPGADGLVGVNLAPWLQFRQGALRYSGAALRVSKATLRHPLASTQIYGTLTVPAQLAPPGGETRPLIEETTLPVFLKTAGSPPPRKEEKAELWPADHPYSGHRWAMAIDLTACTGCSACVVACQAENNIPVVGRDEIRRNREMHWLRIDRYYSEQPGGQDVDVAYQPMMCQQCDHAPCETVCPVLATVHSEEGLNMQVYNRCVGTRYCANNCPYKARRFNWFDYAHDDRLQDLVLNPDVTVRSRGVMEKCTFCVQRIQEAKIEAKREGRTVADGEIQPACQQSCPAQAIVFGDLNDPKSRVAQLAASRRSSRLLEELNVRPSVAYLNLVRNREGGQGKNHG